MRVEKIPQTVIIAAYGLLLLAAAVPVLYRELTSATAPDFVVEHATALDQTVFTGKFHRHPGGSLIQCRCMLDHKIRCCCGSQFAV